MRRTMLASSRPLNDDTLPGEFTTGSYPTIQADTTRQFIAADAEVRFRSSRRRHVTITLRERLELEDGDAEGTQSSSSSGATTTRWICRWDVTR